MANNKTRPLVYGGILLVAVVGLILTAPVKESDSNSSKNAKKGRKSSGKAVVFTQEDLEAKFPPMNSALKNAFVPLVARSESGSSGGLAPNELPTSLTSGEPGWFYTGTVIVDEVPSALIENEKTGEGMYLKIGEKFKNAMITEIAPTYIVVSTSSGRPIRLNLLDDAPEFDEAPYTGISVEPVRPSAPTGLIGPGRTTGVPNAIPNEQP